MAEFGHAHIIDSAHQTLLQQAKLWLTGRMA